jgi:Spy/CpxP family protein refolding chaperone
VNIRWNQVAIAAAAGLLAGALLYDLYRAHRPHGPRDMGGPMEMFNSELGLSVAQKTQVSAIFEKYRPEMDKIMEENRPKMEAVRKRLDAEIRAVLTPEQAGRLDKLQTELTGPHGGPPHWGPPPGHGVGEPR